VENDDSIDIEASINGDGEAYARLVNRYQAQITRLVWRFTRDRGLCEELVQEVFVEAYFSLKSYRAEGPFIHWLKKIATRVGYRLWKTQARESPPLPLSDYDVAEEGRRGSIDPSAAGKLLHALLARVPRADRLVLTLMYFEDCSTKEIAQRMGWTRAMVKMRAYRARKRLKDIAEREELLEALGWIH
jgi:RNA polymerase sigma-70 factor (ECF subfamily)